MLITCIKTFIKKLPTWSGQVILRISKPEVSGIIFVSLWIFFPERLSPGIYHPNPMQIWSSRPFRKHIIPETVQLDWCFTLIEDHSTQPLHFENCLMNWMLSSPSRKRDILLITPAAKVSSNISKEETNRRNFRTYRDLYHSVFQYIEGFYNSRRPHGSLGYLTPNEMEATFWDRQGI